MKPSNEPTNVLKKKTKPKPMRADVSTFIVRCRFSCSILLSLFEHIYKTRVLMKSILDRLEMNSAVILIPTILLLPLYFPPEANSLFVVVSMPSENSFIETINLYAFILSIKSTVCNISIYTKSHLNIPRLSLYSILVIK